MQIVRRLTGEDGLVTDQFFTSFNKPQCIGGIVRCNVIRKDKEQLLTFKQEVLEDLEKGTPEHAKVWLQVRKLASRAKPANTRLRVIAYEYDKKTKKYLTLLELA